MLPAEILADADAALTAGEAARGLHLIDHLLRTFPEHLQARTLRAQALLELGDEDGATADAATVLSADLLNVDALLISARLAEAQGDLHQGHALIGRAASIEPGHAGVRKAFADSVTVLPRDSAALGLSYLAHGWPDLAERELRAALARDSSRVDVRVGLAEALWQQGRYEEARPECRTVLDHNPRCLRATLMMAHILAEQGRTAHGVEMLEQAGELDPEFTIAAELYAKATLSRMSLPPAPSVSEPPPYVDEAVAEATADDDGAAVAAPDADESAESHSDPETDAATEDGEIAVSDAAEEEDKEPAADGVVAEPTVTADPAASFYGGWPAAAPAASEITDPARIDPDQAGGADVPQTEADGDAAEEVVAGPAPVAELSTETVATEREPKPVAEPEPEPEPEAEAATAEPEPEPESPDDGRAALIGMARIGGWDSVVETLAERLAGEDLGDIVAIIEKLDELDGFPIEIWRLLGDHYLRNRRPQLASEAYFRAVRRNS